LKHLVLIQIFKLIADTCWYYSMAKK